MGCSASKIETFVTKDKLSSNLSSSSHSQCACSTPLSRTLSLPASFVHHPPKGKNDTDHLVSLTSTTYGVLSLPQDPNFMDQELDSSSSSTTLVCDSPHCVVINAWELMEGLDELVDVEKVGGFEFDDELLRGYEIVEYRDSKPLWQHLSVESLLANMDPNVGSSYRKALRSKRFESSEMKDVVKKGWMESELDCESRKVREEFDGKELHERSSRKWNIEMKVVKKGRRDSELDCESEKAKEEMDLSRKKEFDGKELHERSSRKGNSEMKDVVKKGWIDSELDCESKKGMSEMDLSRKKEFDGKELHERSSRKWNSELNVCGIEEKIVLYYTSMRGIRKTYQDCCEVRMIFREYRVFVDERDTSMDPSYRKELQDMLKGKEMSLPQVFVKGEYIGGADQIRKLHEAGGLREVLKGFPIFDLAVACEICGDARFVLCLNCNGSRKVFEENKEKMRCLECNENGLVRCPSC